MAGKPAFDLASAARAPITGTASPAVTRAALVTPMTVGRQKGDFRAARSGFDPAVMSDSKGCTRDSDDEGSDQDQAREKDQAEDQVRRHGDFLPWTGRRPYQPAFMRIVTGLQDRSSDCHGHALWGERNRRGLKLQGKLRVT